MPDPDMYLPQRRITFRAGSIFSVEGLLSEGGYYNEKITTIKASDTKQYGFFFSLSWSFLGNVTMTLSSQIDPQKIDHEKTMVVLGQNAGQFKVQKPNGSSEEITLMTKPCPELYVNYTTTKNLAKSLTAYFKNVVGCSFDTRLKQVNVAKDDVLFCILSTNDEGAMIKGQQKGSKLIKTFSIYGGHDPMSQSTLGKVSVIKKGDLNKLTVDIPTKSTSYGFFIAAPAIDINEPLFSQGCWVAFKSGS